MKGLNQKMTKTSKTRAEKAPAKKSPKTTQRKTPKTGQSGQEGKLSYEEKKELKLKAQKEKACKNVVPANKDRFYCTNADLLAEMTKWRDSAKKPEDRIISEEFGRMMMAIANKMLNRSEFRNYPKELKEDMASAGLLKIIKGLKNYDFRFTNVFSYLSTSLFNCYLTILKKHYKHVNIKKEMLTKLLMEMQTIPGLNPASSLAKALKQYCDDCSADGGGED